VPDLLSLTLAEKESFPRAISLPDTRYLFDDILQALRLQDLRRRELGCTKAQLAGFHGIMRATISRWWSA
jgi:hypothetical protein